MRFAGTALLVVLAAGCANPTPVAIQKGDRCFRCGREIIHTRLATEILDDHGRAFKFRTVWCVSQYLRDHPTETGRVYVTDYTTGRLVRAQTATYVRATIDPDTYEMDYLAFSTVGDAVKAARESKSAAIDWLRLMAHARRTARAN